MERKLKTCGVCGLEKVMWKSKTRNDPQMCKYCYEHRPKTSMLDSAISAIQDMQLAVLKQRNPKEDKSIPELLKLATIVFNRWIRERDCNWGISECISCGIYRYYEDIQAGHYMPSTYSELRFNELNVNSECARCNCGDDKHLIGYRTNLIKKIGLEKVEWLESHKIATSHKWEKQELLDIISKYK